MAAQKLTLARVHIHNIKSVEDGTLDLRDSNYVFGSNNSGKSNLLFALNAAFGNVRVDREDIYVSRSSPYSEDKQVYVDMMFKPADGREFSEEWVMVLGPLLSFGEDGQFFGVRTYFEYDGRNNSYRRKRRSISSWGDVPIPSEFSVTEAEMSHFECLFVNAQRDISVDLHDRQSLWNRSLSSIEIPDDVEADLSQTVTSLNDRIIGGSEVLARLSEELQQVPSNGRLMIRPLPASASDIYNGLEIKVDEGGSPLPVSSMGLGSRSIATITAIRALSNMSGEREGPHYTLIMIEEPEEHLHPQLQSHLRQELMRMESQKVITTHSPYVLAGARLPDMVRAVHGTDGTVFHSHVGPEEDTKDAEDVIGKFLSPLMFSRTVIFVEGYTEELALPVYFQHRFGFTPEAMDVTFVRVNGTGYRPYLQIARDFELDWMIFSDGEEEASKKVDGVVKAVFGEDVGKIMDERVFMIPDGLNYEGYVIRFAPELSHRIALETRNIKSRDPIHDIESELPRRIRNKIDYARPLAEALCEAGTVPPLISELLDAISTRLPRCSRRTSGGSWSPMRSTSWSSQRQVAARRRPWPRTHRGTWAPNRNRARSSWHSATGRPPTSGRGWTGSHRGIPTGCSSAPSISSASI